MTTDPRRRARAADATVAAVVAAVVLAPVLLARGYVLRGDLVFVPGQPWKGAWLGLGGELVAEAGEVLEIGHDDPLWRRCVCVGEAFLTSEECFGGTP